MTDPPVRLTPREQQIAALLYEGLGHHRIALRLGISVGTVARHISFARLKIGRPGRPSLLLAKWYADRLMAEEIAKSRQDPPLSSP